MRLFVAILSILLTPVISMAALVFNEGWDSGIGAWEQHGGCYSYSFQVVPDPCNVNDNVLQVTNIIGDHNGNCDNEWDQLAPDPGVGHIIYKHRAELTPLDSATHVNNLDEFRVGFRVFIPEGYPLTSVGMYISNIIPELLTEADWKFRIHRDNRWRQEITLVGDDVINYFGQAPRDQWVNFVLYYKRSTSGSGEATLWRNGSQIFNYAGITSQTANDPALWKLGITTENSVQSALTGSEYRLLFDDIKIAVGIEDEYATVAPTKTSGVCGAPPVVPDFPETPVLDQFTRANETSIAAPWANGVTGTGTCSLTSSTLRAGTGTEDCYWNDTFNTPMEVYATLPSVASHADTTSTYLFACLQDSPGSPSVDGYALKYTRNASAADTIIIQKMANSVLSDVGIANNIELLNGHRIGMLVVGDGNIEIYADTGIGWELIASETDGSPLTCTGTYVGAGPTDASHVIDNFGGGDTGDIPPTTPTNRLVPSQYTTIQSAVDAANPGDSILVSPGMYYETVTVTKNDLTFQSTTEHAAIIDGGGARTWGFFVQGGVDDGTIDGFAITGQTDTGIMFDSASTASQGWTITDNKISKIWKNGILIRGATSSHEVANNEIFLIGNSSSATGIKVESVTAHVHDNRIYMVGRDGIQVTQSDNLIEDNIVSQSAVCLSSWMAAGGNEIFNNYFYDCGVNYQALHNQCNAGQNLNYEWFMHNTLAYPSHASIEVGANEPTASCIEIKNNAIVTTGERFVGDISNSSLQVRDLFTANEVIDGNIYQLDGAPIFRQPNEVNPILTTISELRTDTPYEVNGSEGEIGLEDYRTGLTYSLDSAALTAGLNLSTPYTTQVGARNLVQADDGVHRLLGTTVHSASLETNMSRLVDGSTEHDWSGSGITGWFVIELNAGNDATFEVFAYHSRIADNGNIKSFRLEISDVPDGSWTEVLNVSESKTDTLAGRSYFALDAPVTAKYARVNVDSTYNNKVLMLSEAFFFSLEAPVVEEGFFALAALTTIGPPIFDGGDGSGALYYVSPAGIGTTCSVGTPCSYTEGINRAQPGQSVVLTDGTYNIALSTVRSGTDGAHIVIRAQNPLGATVSGSAADLVEIDHSYITLKDIHFFDTKTGFPNAANPAAGLKLLDVGVGQHHIIIEGNHFEHCANVCIYIPGITTPNTFLIVRDNFFDGSGYKDGGLGRVLRISSSGLANVGVQDIIVYGNEFSDFLGRAIDMRESTTRAWIYENVFDGQTTASSHGITPELASANTNMILALGSGVQFYKNILRNSTMGTELIRARNSNTSDVNSFFNNIMHDITGNTVALGCQSGNTGATTQFYNNTLWQLSNHTVDTAECILTVVNNLGINGIANNLATSGFDATYFEDEASGNFALTDLATGAIDATTVEPWSDTDFVGRSIVGGVRDYGAYEAGEPTPPPPPPPSGAFPTSAIIDDFNRADENPVDGGIWTPHVASTDGDLEIVSNLLRYVAGSGNSAYVSESFGANQEAYMTFPNATNHIDDNNSRIFACLQSSDVGTSAPDGYTARFRKKTASTDLVYLERLTNGSFTAISNLNEVELDNGDKMGIEILSNGTINLWVDTGSGWTLIDTEVDSTYSCEGTHIGVKLVRPESHGDDFGGGDIVTSSSGVILSPGITFFD